MRLFNKIFGRKKLLSLQPADLQMWQTAKLVGTRPSCNCLKPQYEDGIFKELHLHTEIQDTKCDAWLLLEDLIQKAVLNQADEFAPGLTMPPEMWSQIIILPTSIKQLKSVKRLYLYGSHLIRIPVEIGEMTNLEEFDAYTSYRLHWLPYEITRCLKLKRSRISTRALYGNYKYRPPFPRLETITTSNEVIHNCSVCARELSEPERHQVWISLRVGTDVLPLLVHACSQKCIQQLPPPAKGYVDHPHEGGLTLRQPETEH